MQLREAVVVVLLLLLLLLLRMMLLMILMEERTQEPMFRMPQGKGKQLPTRIFDDVIIGLLLEMHKRRGEHKSLAQIRKLYSLHSFRIGGVNALRAAGVPREIRMILGRWRSDAIDVYSRTDIQQFAKYLRDQGISCREFETLAEDLPQHDEAQGSEFGTAYSVLTNEDSAIPKVTPDISAAEAKHEMSSLIEAAQYGVELPNRQHSLVGRKVELTFGDDDAADDGEYARSVPGVVARAEPGAALPFIVTLLGGVEERVSIQDVVDNLVGEHDDVDDHLALPERLNIA